MTRWFTALSVAMLFASTGSAASISTQIVLLDEFDVQLPHVGSVWTVPKGTTFRVQLQGAVLSPNVTDQSTTRAAALRGQPLGLNNLTGQLVTSGVNVVNPVGDNSTNPATWVGFTEAIGAGIPASVNLNDVDADGDLDADGAATASIQTVVSSAANLASAQLGALSANPVPFFEGQYFAANFGSTLLSFIPQTSLVFTDPAASSTAVQAVSAAVTGGPITINVPAPEPSSFALAGLAFAGMGLLRRRSK